MPTKKTVDKSKSHVTGKSKINPDDYTKIELVNLVLENDNIDVSKAMANKLTKAELCYILSEADKKMIKVKPPSHFDKVGFDTELVADNILKNIRSIDELKNIVSSGIGGPVFKQFAKEKLKEVKEATSRLEEITKDHDRISVNKREVKSLISKADINNTLLKELVKYSLVHNETDMFKILLKNGARNLKELDLQYTEVSDISQLSNLVNLKELNLGGCRGLSDVSPLSNLVNLKELGLYQTQVSDVSPLAGLINLKVLSLDHTNVSDISQLSNLVNLKELNLGGCRGLSDVSPLKDPLGPVNLEKLDLEDTQVSDLSPLKSLVNLKELNLKGTEVWDISPLSNLKNLTYLNIGVTLVSDLSPLKSLKNLKKLGIWLTEVSDFSPLSNLENLEELVLGGNITIEAYGGGGPQYLDVSPLDNLKNLKEIYLWADQSFRHFIIE